MSENFLYCVDFETTKDSAKELHIIEIGAVLLNNELYPCEQFSSLIRPPCRIDPIDARVTGLSDSDLELAEPCSLVFPRLLEFVGESTVLAHNANYDMRVVEVTCKQLDMPLPKWSFVDTLRLARHYIKAKSYSLPKLVSELGIVYQQHRALPDCEATASLFRHIIHIISKGERTNNNHALMEALRIGKVEEAIQRKLF